MTHPVLNDQAAEHAVIGACVTSATALRVATVDHGLRQVHITDTRLQAVLRGCQDLADRHASYDAAMVTGRLATEGFADVVAQLVTAAARIRDLPGHIATLTSLERRRRHLQAGHHLQQAALTGDDHHLAQAEHLLADTDTDGDTTEALDLGHLVTAWLQSTDSIGMPTGLGALDDQIGGGLRPGEMTALGGWTNHGKSPLCDQILTHAAQAGHRAHLYINEMSRRDRALRMVAHAGAAPIDRLQTRELRDDRERHRILQACGHLPFGVTDVAAWDHQRICRHLRANRYDLAAVDLLHNLPHRDTRDLDEIIRSFAAAARVSNTHLILVCHFNEERAKAEELPKPVARDLRGSGMIKNACRNVLLLHRFQDRVTNELGDPAYDLSDRAVVVCDKATHGQRGDVALVFDGRHMRFRLPDITDRRMHAT